MADQKSQTELDALRRLLDQSNERLEQADQLDALSRLLDQSNERLEQNLVELLASSDRETEATIAEITELMKPQKDEHERQHRIDVRTNLEAQKQADRVITSLTESLNRFYRYYGKSNYGEGASVNSQKEAYVGPKRISINDERTEQEMKNWLLGSREGKERSGEIKNEEGYLKLTNELPKVENLKMKGVMFDQSDQSPETEKILEFKKGQHGTKKISLTNWLGAFVESDEDWEAVNAIRAEAVKLATKLSHMLVDLMILLSEDEDMAEKFQIMRSELKQLAEVEDSTVICRIVAILEMVYQKVQNTRTFKKVESHEGNSLTKKVDLNYSGSKEVQNSHVNQLITQFLDEIIRLDNILMPQEQELYSMTWLKDILCLLKADLQKCEKELKDIESKTISANIFWPYHKTNIHEKIELKINELWNQVLQDSEKDEDNLVLEDSEEVEDLRSD